MYSYLALGDSYTIGEAVSAAESFPFQLAQRLRELGISVQDPKIIAKTGWTTDELQQAIAAENLQQQFDLVTLLIGVNNQYRNYSTAVYREEFRALLQQAIQFSGNRKERVVVVSIPDWGVTPFCLSSDKDPVQVAAAIDAFNVINREETALEAVAYVDITGESRKAEQDRSLLAVDGLHYSGKMHGAWVDKIAPSVISVLKREELPNSQ